MSLPILFAPLQDSKSDPPTMLRPQTGTGFFPFAFVLKDDRNRPYAYLLNHNHGAILFKNGNKDMKDLLKKVFPSIKVRVLARPLPHAPEP